SFRVKVFLAAWSAAAIALAVAGVVLSESMRRRTDERIERGLVAQARLTADLLARTDPSPGIPALDAEADHLGDLAAARVTLIDHGGRVVGDSAEPLDALATLENHGSRPEIVQAGASGLGVARRYSATLNVDMLYVAVPTRHPLVAFVRVALPLTEVRQQLAA